MFLQGFDCIVGTGGLEPAALRKQRSNGFLIYPDKESQDFTDTLADAIKEAYRLADGVRFEKAYRRSDIGQRGLAAYK